jgi:acetyl esterase/lipase
MLSQKLQLKLHKAGMYIMKIISLLFIALLLSSCAKIGTAILNSKAKTDDYTITPNLVYGHHRQNKLDIYRPIEVTANTGKKIPVIVFFYGGCWGECNSLDKSDYRFVAQSFASRGYVVVIPDFRQYAEVNFAGIMSDASGIIRWIDQNISEYGGDPTRLVLTGHSSGAHIASMLTLDARYLDTTNRNKIRGFVGLAGPYDFLPLDKAYQRKLFGPPRRYADSQPINFLSPQTPPLLILHGGKDTTVGKHNAVNLTQKAQNIGVSHKLIIYPEHDHVGILLALSSSFQKHSAVYRDVLDFIRHQCCPVKDLTKKR